MDSTANTDVVMWANKLVCLKDVACPYVADPFTLETLEYDPFKSEIESQTFTAHPKIDPYTNELVVSGYEAKGLATLDVETYTLNKESKKVNELWLKSPRCAFIHDSAITKNWLILMLWPFEAISNGCRKSDNIGLGDTINQSLSSSFLVGKLP